MKINEKPPDIFIKFIILVIGAIAWLWVGWWIYHTWLINPVEGQIEREYSEIIVVQGSALKASTPVNHINPRVLGLMAYDLEYETALLLNKIAECESGWKTNVCNGHYGCRGGQGVFQLIPSTVKYCEKKLGKPIDPFNEADNIECAIWLMTNEGWGHWGDSSTWWGSYYCFKDYVN